MVDYRKCETFFSRRIYDAIYLTGVDIKDEYLIDACVIMYWNLIADSISQDDDSCSDEFPEMVRQHFRIIELPDAQPHHMLFGNFFYHESYSGGIIQYRVYSKYTHSLYYNGIVRLFRQISDPQVLIEFDDSIPGFIHWAQYLIDKERCIFKMNLALVSAVQRYTKQVLKDFKFSVYPYEKCPVIKVKMKRGFVLTVELPLDGINEVIDGLPYLIHHPLLIRKAGDNFHLDKGDYEEGKPRCAGAYYND